MWTVSTFFNLILNRLIYQLFHKLKNFLNKNGSEGYILFFYIQMVSKWDKGMSALERAYYRTIADNLSEIQLGIDIEETAKDPAKLEILQKYVNRFDFPNVHSHYIKRAFLNAVASGNDKMVGYFFQTERLSHWLESREVIDGLRICLDHGFSLSPFLTSPLFTEMIEEGSQEIRPLILLAHERGRYEMIDALAQIPAGKAVLDSCLSEMLDSLVSIKNFQRIKPFLDFPWTAPLPKKDLAAIAAKNGGSYLLFRALVSHPRYDEVCQEGLISSKLSEEHASALFQKEEERVVAIAFIKLFSCESFKMPDKYETSMDNWCLAIEEGLRKGRDQRIVKTLLEHMELLLHIPDKKREFLFVFACKTSVEHPENWAVAKTLIHSQEIREAFPVPIVEQCVRMAGELNIPNILQLQKLPQFQQMNPNTIKEGFTDACTRGHGDAAQAFSKFFSDTELNELFLLFMERGNEKEMETLAACPCFSRVTDENLERSFAPLIAIGKLHEKDEDHGSSIATFRQNAPEAVKFNKFCSKIVGSPRFAGLFKQEVKNYQNLDLRAIFIASAGMGFFFITSHIYQLRRDEFPLPIIVLAVRQTCSGRYFLSFYQEGKEMRFDHRFSLIEDAWHLAGEKKMLLKYFLEAVWPLKNFNDPHFREKIYPHLKKFLMTTAQFKSKEEMHLIIDHYRGRWISSDLQAAYQEAEIPLPQKGNSCLIS